MKLILQLIVTLLLVACGRAGPDGLPIDHAHRRDTLPKQHLAAVATGTTRTLSPCGGWAAITEGPDLFVARADGSGKQRLHQTATTLFWCWCPGDGDPVLLFGFGPSNTKNCRAYLPAKGIEVGLSNRAVNRIPECDSYHAIPLDCSPDNRWVLLRVVSSRRGAWREEYFVVATQTGRVLRRMRTTDGLPYTWWR